MITRERRWPQLVKITKPLFASAIRWRTLVMLALIIIFLLALNGSNVVNSYVGRNFITALTKREAAAFYTFALYYLGIFCVSTIVAVFYQFFQDRLALFWRKSLTRHFLGQYLAEQAYYRLRAQTEIDNPDQRISEDVRSFTTTLLSFALLILNSSITIVTFAGILWLIAPQLVLAAVLYAIVGSLITILLGYRLVGLNYLQLAKEADLRYGLVRIREYAEPIALLQGEPEEDHQVLNRLERVVEIVKRVIAVNRNMGFFTSYFNYLVPILPIILVAPSYLRGEIEFGEVTQAAMAFAQLVGALAVFIAQFQNFSAFAAVVTRLGSLETAIQEAQTQAQGQIHIAWDDTRVAYDKLTLTTPPSAGQGGRVLIKELSLEIPRGRRLLIKGNDGAGKSALFRATAGLWSNGTGSVVCPHRDKMMFLPQKPYTILGNLRDQMLYGLHEHSISDEQILEVLRALKFDSIVQRVGGLDSERDWLATLSIGEQQQLAFVRLLLANPRFAFLDQAISSLDPQRGKQLYQLLAATSITYLSVGDHVHIQEYHDLVLELTEVGSWKTHPPAAHGASEKAESHPELVRC
jgi:vitamin B12/bleomycin/antimicrobial peptide transport system ATP-binding/permease protein